MKYEEPGYWQCAQHGLKCLSYAGWEANDRNRREVGPHAEPSVTVWVSGRFLTYAEMDANEKYWESFGRVNLCL